MYTSHITRRGVLASSAILGSSALVSGCMSSDGGGQDSEGGDTLALQNSRQLDNQQAALQEVMSTYGEHEVTINSVATEQFRSQLSTYLSSSNPPDVFTWYAGSVANAYAEEGLLLDLSELWQEGGACENYSEALRELSTGSDGKQIFVPDNYYWWSIFYKESAFESWGVEPVDTWDEFLDLCETLLEQGIYPLSNGVGPTPWMAAGWFDYINLRINGADYHRALLAGEHSFEDAEVVEVMEQYARLIPYFHPSMVSWDQQQAVTPIAQNEAAMYLTGSTSIVPSMPSDQREDLNFFSVPTMDPSVPSAEEAPTDGYFAAANGNNPDAVRELLSYVASPETQEAYIDIAASSALPTSPDVDTSQFSPIVQKGIELLNNTEQVTQFFNRDSSDALQATADAALTAFLADPSDIPGTLREWQKAADGVRDS